MTLSTVTVTATALFNCLQRANDITAICDDMAMAQKVLHEKINRPFCEKDLAEMKDFLQAQFAKYKKSQKKFALQVQKVRAFSYVFGAYDDEKAVRDLYVSLLKQQDELGINKRKKAA